MPLRPSLPGSSRWPFVALGALACVLVVFTVSPMGMGAAGSVRGHHAASDTQHQSDADIIAQLRREIIQLRNQPVTDVVSQLRSEIQALAANNQQQQAPAADVAAALRAELKGLAPPACPSPAPPTVVTRDVVRTVGAGKTDYPVDCGVNNACSGQGTCYIGKCFCDPGASGQHCEVGTPKPCASIEKQADRLTCFFHPSYGSARVDLNTWRTALNAESGVWAGSSDSNDRSDEHSRGYGRFAAFKQGQDMGSFVEFGCGPWTQTKTSLVASRPDLKFKSITLSDPNLHNYVQNVPQCSYKSGTLIEGVMTYLVAAGAEAPLFTEAFDTVMMTNVLEHVQNAYAVLHNLWASLKPGGILIFNDRWVDEFPFHSHVELNNILHPVRVKKPVLDWLLSHFDEMYRNEQGTEEMRQRGDIGVYFIGRKKLPAGQK